MKDDEEAPAPDRDDDTDSLAERPAAGRFASGQLVADRYLVVSTFGEGRLDEVYEADDLRLNERIKLRVLRRDDGEGDSGLKRLQHLVERTSHVRHPNVETVHELGWHVEPDGGGRAVFVTSELVRGQTLTQTVRPRGPMSPTEARPVIERLCAGLEAVHRAHLLHGDIGGSTVILTRHDDGSLSPVITDFSFSIADDTGTSPPDRFTSSPAYRAPELLSGRPISRQTDIFSLGAVIYELLTAHLPFTGGNLLALDFRQLEEKPLPLRETVPGIDPVWERVVLRCLEKAPEDRFSRVSQLLRAFDGERISTPRRTINLATFGAAALLIAVMVGGSAIMSYFSVLEGRRQAAALELRSRPSIAVLSLRDVSGASGDAWVATAVSELLRDELDRGEDVRVASGEAVWDAETDLGLESVEVLDGTALKHMRTMLSAEAVVVGSCRVDRSRPEPTVILDLCVQDTRSGETLGAVTEAGHPEELMALVLRASDRLRGIAGLPPQPARNFFQRPAWTATGLRSYAAGIAALHRRDTENAVAAFRVAIRTDPENPAVRLALARVLWQTGNVAQALREQDRAFEASTASPREEVLGLQARRYELRGNWRAAVDAHRERIRSFPDRLEHGLALVRALLQAGDATEAKRALRSLRSLAPLAGDPRLDLLDARVNSRLGRLDESRSSAQRAVELALAIGARRVEGEALVEEALTASILGRADEAGSCFARAQTVFRDRGDIDELARISVLRASAAQRNHAPDEAIVRYGEAERAYQQAGQKQGVAATRGSLALLLAAQGRHREAIPLFEPAILAFEEIGDKPNASRSRIGLANSLMAVGDLGEAAQQLATALEEARSMDIKPQRAIALLALGRLAMMQGKLDEAADRVDEAEAQFQSIGLRPGTVESWVAQGEIQRLKGDLAGARSLLIQAFHTYEMNGESEGALAIRLALARLQLDSHESAGAAVEAEKVANGYAILAGPPGQAEALLIEASARAELGDPIAARIRLAEAEPLCAQIDDLEIRVLLETVKARLGKADPATLQKLVSEASKGGAVTIQIEALLAAADSAEERRDGRGASTLRESARTLAERSGCGLYTLNK